MPHMSLQNQALKLTDLSEIHTMELPCLVKVFETGLKAELDLNSGALGPYLHPRSLTADTPVFVVTLKASLLNR